MRKMVAERPTGNSVLSYWKTLAMVLIGAMSLSSAHAQSSKPASKSAAGTQKTHASRSKAAAALANEPLAATPVPPPPPPKPLAPEKMPPQVPQVAWDGKLLTINADNSTLSDILVAVRMLTGADVDVPPEASRERIAARLGPAPPREVLSTLLSWTNFDFVIQASENDPAGLRNVILTPRSKSDTVVAANSNSAAESTRSTFFARANGRKNVPVAATENPEPAQENPAPASSETAESAPQPEPAPASEKGQSDATQAANAAATSPKPAATDGNTAVAAAPAVASDSQTAAQPTATASATTTDSSSSTPSNPVQEKIQQMQSMFEQRKQMIIDSRKQGQSQ